MNSSKFVPFAAVMLALGASCRSHSAANNAPEGAHNLWVNEWYADASKDAAVIRQATLFSGQFRPGTAELTGVGARDLDVLIAHYGEHGGAISVRRGTASAELYAARVSMVEDAILEAGVPEGRLTIADQRPGGAGLPSHEAAAALTRPPFEITSETTNQTAGTTTGNQGGQR